MKIANSYFCARIYTVLLNFISSKFKKNYGTSSEILRKKEEIWITYSELICVKAFIRVSRSNGSAVPISTLLYFNIIHEQEPSE
jgi:hypothetical protein